MISKLPLEDARHLSAADGWLDLGDHVSAFEQLEEIAPLNRAHPEVLKLRLRIYSTAKKWDSTFALAEGLHRQLPDDPEVTLALARCCTVAGRLDDARQWLTVTFEKAERQGTAKLWKLKALDDQHLAPLFSSSSEPA